MAQPPQQWFLNTPILWLAALVLIGLLRGPLRNAPTILKKPLNIGVATLAALGLLLLLVWNPVLRASKVSPALTAFWILFLGLTPIVWMFLFFRICLSRSKQNRGAAPVTVGEPAPGPQAQQQAVTRNVPTERFADVGGLDDAKEQIRQVVQPHLNPGKYERYGLLRNGILTTVARQSIPILERRVAARTMPEHDSQSAVYR